MSETELQKLIRVELSQRGARVWRNNRGVAMDRNGRPVRFGLGNESAALNAHIKSSDLIGIAPYQVTAADVGRILGVFISIECKAPGWRFRGTDREKAQLRWIDMVKGLGGKGGMISCVEQLNQMG